MCDSHASVGGLKGPPNSRGLVGLPSEAALFLRESFECRVPELTPATEDGDLPDPAENSAEASFGSVLWKAVKTLWKRNEEVSPGSLGVLLQLLLPFLLPPTLRLILLLVLGRSHISAGKVRSGEPYRRLSEL